MVADHAGYADHARHADNTINAGVHDTKVGYVDTNEESGTAGHGKKTGPVHGAGRAG